MNIKITPQDILFICTALGAWFLLGIAILKGFLSLQTQERDTRFPEESGKKPESNHIGRGGMNGARPTRNTYARVTFYADFFVAGFAAQRIALPYSSITGVERIQRRKRSWVLINAIQPDTEKTYTMYFFNDDVDDIEKTFKAKIAS